MAADSLAVLAEALSPPVSSGDFLLKLRSDDAVRLGLNAFCSVLRRGLQSSDDGTSRFLCWTDAQIHAISSLAYEITFASRSLSGNSSLFATTSQLDFRLRFAAVLRFRLCDPCSDERAICKWEGELFFFWKLRYTYISSFGVVFLSDWSFTSVICVEF